MLEEQRLVAIALELRHAVSLRDLQVAVHGLGDAAQPPARSSAAMNSP